MEKLIFPNLKADQIECRIGTCREDGVSLLLYKDARCDMNLLDEVVGPYNWKREHKRDNANCVVSLWDSEKKEWVSKEDVGTESNTEEQKGLASDSFKRACVLWGIGRALYTSPFIWFSNEECNISKNQKGKVACYDKFTVTDIKYDDNNKITSVTIYNSKKKSSKTFRNSTTTKKETTTKKSASTAKKETETSNDLISKTEAKALAEVCKKKNINIDKLLEQYKVKSFEEFSKESYRNLIERLKKIDGGAES